ncbi:MAG: GGDEF domain-containing protein [Clostridiales bacterium]|nr:GGDEF domain-containing protein [Clostridiales bacterium]
MAKILAQDINIITQYRKWNRLLFRVYWAVFGVFVVFAAILYFYQQFGHNPEAIQFDFRFYIALPIITIFILLSVTNILYYLAFSRWTSFIQACYILTVYIILCTVIISINYHNFMLYTLYAGPIMLSVLYLDVNVINYTCLTCVAAYTVASLVFILPYGNPEYYGWTTYSLFTAFTLLAIAYIIARLILARINEAVDTAKSLAMEKEQLSRELERDSFTRLFNHIAFYQRLDQCIQNAQNANTVFSLIIMDIDDFKQINDNFGHANGDIVLLKFVETINKEISADDLAFRYGGEEFIMLCPKPIDYAVSLAERVRKRFSSHVFAQLSGNRVTVSSGVCEYESSFGGRREFFSAADKALYYAKQDGKNRTAAANGSYKIYNDATYQK